MAIPSTPFDITGFRWNLARDDSRLPTSVWLKIHAS